MSGRTVRNFFSDTLAYMSVWRLPHLSSLHSHVHIQHRIHSTHEASTPHSQHTEFHNMAFNTAVIIWPSTPVLKPHVCCECGVEAHIITSSGCCRVLHGDAVCCSVLECVASLTAHAAKFPIFVIGSALE